MSKEIEKMSQPTFDKGVKKTQLTEIIEKHLGYSGRMIGMSKHRYRENTPEGRPYFNACIFDELLIQVWYGDIDLVLDKEKLDKIAEVSEQPFYVTPEHPYRQDFPDLHPVTREKLDKDEYVIKFNTILKKKKKETKK